MKIDWKKTTASYTLGAFMLGAVGCADCWNQKAQSGGIFGTYAGEYHIVKYSGGKVVEDFWLHDVKVTQNENTDGCLVVKNGNVFEIQGDVTTVRLKRSFNGPDIVPSDLVTYPSR